MEQMSKIVYIMCIRGHRSCTQKNCKDLPKKKQVTYFSQKMPNMAFFELAFFPKANFPNW